MTSPSPIVFDRALVAHRRSRAARAAVDGEFLRNRVVEELFDRVQMVKRRFATALELGGAGAFSRLWSANAQAREQITWLASADIAPEHAQAAKVPGVAADEERLPIADNVLDLVVSPLSLHTVNDLPGALVQVRRALKPDGLFLGALFGRRTLQELRGCLLEAETAITGGAGPRIAPFADAQDMSQLLQRAGFALPVADTDLITVRYREPMRLLADLRAMGETNALVERPRRGLRRDVLGHALSLYQERFGEPDGRMPATFEIVTATGWAPDASQQQPLKPGSARARLADALGAEEQSAGEQTGTTARRSASD